MIQKKSLCFVRPKLWDDPFEGFVFQKLKSEIGWLEIKELIEKEFPNSGSSQMMLQFGTKLERMFYAQSWSRCDNDDAMWRIYSHNNMSIRISAAEENIRKLDKVSIIEVEYEDEISFRSELVRDLPPHLWPSPKRVFFDV